MVKRKKRGIGLVAVMGAVTVLSLFTGVILGSVTRTLKAVADGEKTDRARYAAYSGIQSALSRLNTPGQAGWSHILPTESPTSTNPDHEDLIQVTFRLEDGVTKDPDLQAIVGVYNNSAFCPATHRSTVGPDGSPIPEGSILIVSTGLARDKGRIELSNIGATVGASGYQFDKAIFTTGKTSVMGTSEIDSFDSGTGNSVGVNPDFTFTPYSIDSLPKLKAHIGTRSADTDASTPGVQAALEVEAGSKVDGNAFNPGDDPTNFSGSRPGDLKGDIEDSQSKEVPPTFDPGAMPALPAPVGPVYTVNSGVTYKVTGDLVLGPGSVLNISPPAGTNPILPISIYVTGKVDLNGATINMIGASTTSGKRPSLLQIYLIDGTAPAANRVKIKDTTGSFVLAGKDAKADVQNSTLFGALMVDECKLSSSSKLHFDERLAQQAVGNGDLSITNMFSGSTGAPATVTSVASDPASYPPPQGTGAGCGCGCGCLMAEQQCL